VRKVIRRLKGSGLVRYSVLCLAVGFEPLESQSGTAGPMCAARPRDVLVLGASLAVYGTGVSLALAEVTPAVGWTGVGLGALPPAAKFVWRRRKTLDLDCDTGLQPGGIP
jgi:hypothetical protein